MNCKQAIFVQVFCMECLKDFYVTSFMVTVASFFTSWLPPFFKWITYSLFYLLPSYYNTIDWLIQINNFYLVFLTGNRIQWVL